MVMSLLLMAAAAAGPAKPIPSTPDLGTAEARCRPNETGPAALFKVTGFKDRKGLVRVEVYPATDQDFLQDDNKLVAEGKTFRRVVMAMPAADPVQLCVRLPAAGRYTAMVHHDRNSDRKLNITDGGGFPNDPKLSIFKAKPSASAATFAAGPGMTDVNITMQYLHGLSVGPIKVK